jgi:hypothetical protein
VRLTAARMQTSWLPLRCRLSGANHVRGIIEPHVKCWHWQQGLRHGQGGLQPSSYTFATSVELLRGVIKVSVGSLRGVGSPMAGGNVMEGDMHADVTSNLVERRLGLARQHHHQRLRYCNKTPHGYVRPLVSQGGSKVHSLLTYQAFSNDEN